MKRKHLLLVLITLVLSLSLLLTSCTVGETVGISGAVINENGELVITYTDGTSENLGTVVGKDGENGKDGKDGKDGNDGNDGNDGELVIVGDVNDTSVAVSKGLRSAVSIRCGFTTTIQTIGPRPNMGSTTTYEYTSAGSGVIYKLDKSEGDAFIVTNYHVVYDVDSNTEDGISDDISVYLYGSENTASAIKAEYVGGSLYYDIAVLHINDSELIKGSDVTNVTPADSENITVGNTAIAIGNAQGYGISASFGVVSVDSEYITMLAADNRTSVSFRVLRVDTAINSGNSGGGLYNADGELIGIVNAKFVDEGVENIGYAIPSRVALAVAENIIDNCFETDLASVQRAMLGISVNVSNTRAMLDTESGLMHIVEDVTVSSVTEASMSDEILLVGDRLISAKLGDIEIDITRRHHLNDLMLNVRVGDTVYVTVERDNEGACETLTLEITFTAEGFLDY